MNGATLLLIATACFLVGYFIYSKFVGRLLGVDPSRPTPAVSMNDGVDYVPAHPTVLFGHHFAAIAGAGPIVGPVLAAEFGWASVALWVVLGCIFIGAAHDMISLFLSVRHKGESIGSVIGDILGRPGRILFLLFSWSALVLVVAEFTRQISVTFVQDPSIASASLLFIGEAILFGVCVYRLKMNVLVASLIFVPIMFGFVWLGGVIPIDLMKCYGFTAAEYCSALASGAPVPAAMAAAAQSVQTTWTLVLLAYCFLASTLPVWLLLQPRDYLNAYLLYAMMILGFLGVFVAHPTLQTDAFTGLSAIGRSGSLEYLFPFLFVTVACGACSGFHALVASGTSAKQLDSERSIRPVAYGGMLLEGVLAVIALIGVAGSFASQAEYAKALQVTEPVNVFASTIAGFVQKMGFPAETARSFMLLSVSAFLMTSVDAGTRLARFSWQEFVAAAAPAEERKERPSILYRVCHDMYVGTGVVVALVCALLLGNPKAAKSLWTIFASANQLLAALTLLTATLWFVRNKKPCWITLVPMCFMMTVSTYALISLFRASITGGNWTVVGATGFLIVVAIALILFSLSYVYTHFAPAAKKEANGVR